jgi:hypothetical protein
VVVAAAAAATSFPSGLLVRLPLAMMASMISLSVRVSCATVVVVAGAAADTDMLLLFVIVVTG